MSAIAILRKWSILFLHRQKRRGRLASEGRFFSSISDIRSSAKSWHSNENPLRDNKSHVEIKSWADHLMS